MEPECGCQRAGAGRMGSPGSGVLPTDACHCLLLLGTQFGTSLVSVPTNRHNDSVCTGERG